MPPLFPGRSQFEQAAARLRGLIVETPLVPVASLGVSLKAETLQRTGSFKIRGALNRLLAIPETDRPRGVACFSSGNHAQAMALAGRLLGIPVTVFMPEDSMAHKVALTRQHGATVIQEGVTAQTRQARTEAFARDHGATLVPPFEDLLIIEGQGTVGMEIVHQQPDVEAVAVPLGGGGLLAGVALAVHAWRPDVKVYGVEPEAGNDGQQSLHSGRRVSIEPPRTLADGARTLSLGEPNFEIIRTHVADILTVSDDDLRSTMRRLALEAHLVVEPTGALAAAAWCKRLLPRARTCVVLSGGNVDPALLADVLQT